MDDIAKAFMAALDEQIPGRFPPPYDGKVELPLGHSQVYSKLLNDNITWSEASNRLQLLPPIWQSQVWAERRTAVLKAHCERCGHSDDILVIQHPFHPPSINDLMKIIASDKGYFLQDVVDSLKSGPFAPLYDGVLKSNRECCPFCMSLTIKFLQNEQLWKCHGVVGKGRAGRQVICGHKFVNPGYRAEYTPANKREIARLNREVYTQAKSEWWYNVCEKYGKQAVLESLEWSRWYLSLEGTRTLCKKCAFKEDAGRGLIK